MANRRCATNCHLEGSADAGGQRKSGSPPRLAPPALNATRRCWTGSPGSRPPLPRSCPTQWRCWTPFTWCAWPGEALDQCRRRVQQAVLGHRNRNGDPLYAARRTLHTGAALLTDKQKDRLGKLFDSLSHGVPSALPEVITLGRTLNKRAADVLAYFDPPGTSNGADRGDQQSPRAGVWRCSW